MKKIVLLLSLALFTCETYASHIFGADLTYTCQGNGNYLITYTYYRDCIGIPAPTSVTLNISNVCGAQSYGIMMQLNPGVNLLYHCPGLTSCDGGSEIGVEKYTYDTVITLTSACQYWILGVSQCCRSSWINSVIDPSNYSLYVEAAINNTNNICDTSTAFENDPVLITCANQLNCIDPGLFDADGDSIVAAFINPLSAPNINLAYDSSYSVQFPMELDSQLTINSSTGIFCFTPFSTIATVYAIKVSTFRNGEFVGEVQRDVILYVENCTASQPDITLSNSTASDTFVCVNNPICLNLITTDPTPNDSTWLSWDSNINSANFTIIPGQNESGTFCWTPGNSDISPLPHCFNAYVSDNNCPVNQSNQKTYCITVYDSATCATLGTEELSRVNKLKIYPQPFNDFINVKIENSKPVKFYINDILGKTVFEKSITANEKEFKVSTEFLLPGIYITSLRSKDGTVIESTKAVKLKK